MTTLRKMTWAEVCARRLERHGLLEPVKPAKLAEQVGRMCGAHAQIITAAELAIGIRVADTTRSSVQDALGQDHSLIKTYGPRGTVHLLPADDLALWTGALNHAPHVRQTPQKSRLMTPEQVEQVIDGIGKILIDAELTIDELTDALAEQVGAWAGEPALDAFQGKWARWREATDVAANRGVLCFGANRGTKVTYTHPARYIKNFRPMDGARALREVVKRYLTAYGPALPQHFGQWFNSQKPWAAKLFESLGDELEPVEVDGAKMFIVAGDTDVPAKPPKGVRLLPYFDAYAVGAHPREKVFPGKAAERALAGGQSGNFPLLLIDGLAAGVWHQKRSGKKIDITVEPLKKLTAAQRRELDEQVERIGVFMGGTPRLTIGTVTVGAHA
jgi:hypothetical protein